MPGVIPSIEPLHYLHSDVNTHLEEELPLLGDSGYPLNPPLMPPVGDEHTHWQTCAMTNLNSALTRYRVSPSLAFHFMSAFCFVFVFH